MVVYCDTGTLKHNPMMCSVHVHMLQLRQKPHMCLIGPRVIHVFGAHNKTACNSPHPTPPTLNVGESSQLTQQMAEKLNCELQVHSTQAGKQLCSCRKTAECEPEQEDLFEGISQLQYTK